jgi:hypothetical protein
VSRGDQEPEETPSSANVFVRVCKILETSKWVDGELQILETANGLRRLRIANPGEGVEELSSRVNLGSLKSEAALLKTFLLLRGRYQEISRLEAHRDDEAAQDSLYLRGDVFTELYPVRAQLELRVRQ